MRTVVMVAAVGAAAVLGGVVGAGAMVALGPRTAGAAPSSPPAHAAAPSTPARWWYCHYIEHVPNQSPGSAVNHFTICEREPDCTSAPCVLSPLAWCGRQDCTFTEEWCNEISGNAPCRATAP